MVKNEAQGVTRIVAPNAGPMTGGGTNTWIFGEGPFVVVDPGPAIEQHIACIHDFVGDNLVAILVTHSHLDHSPGAALLKQRTGAMVYGAVLAQDDGHQDISYSPDIHLVDGQELSWGDIRIKAIATPGHVANHYSFFDYNSGFIATGDHVMNGSTVVIIPPAGDMHDYIESLKVLGEIQSIAMAPGHGAPIYSPRDECIRLINHRLKREAKVLESMSSEGIYSLTSLVASAYDDVDSSLYPIAKFSLWAHLLKLERDGEVEKIVDKHWLADAECWRKR